MVHDYKNKLQKGSLSYSVENCIHLTTNEASPLSFSLCFVAFYLNIVHLGFKKKKCTVFLSVSVTLRMFTFFSSVITLWFLSHSPEMPPSTKLRKYVTYFEKPLSPDLLQEIKKQESFSVLLEYTYNHCIKSWFRLITPQPPTQVTDLFQTSPLWGYGGKKGATSYGKKMC